MSESADLTASMLSQLAKLAKSLSDEEIKQFASGEAKVAVVPAGHRVIEVTPAIDGALKLLRQLAPADLRGLEEKTSKLALLRQGDKVITAFNAVEIAEQVSALKTEEEIVRFLDDDPRLGAPNLKKVAAELSVIVPPSVKAKPALQLHIAQSVVRDRGRWSWR